MTAPTVLALLATSFIGVLYWWAIAIISTQTEMLRKALNEGQVKPRRIRGAITNFTALFLVVAPLAIIIWKAATS